MSSTSSFLAVIALLAGAALCQSCVTPNGFDLSPLTSQVDYSQYDGQKFTYVFNICTPLATLCNFVRGAAVCEEYNAGMGQILVAMTNTQQLIDPVKPGAPYVIRCTSGDSGRTASIEISCDPTKPVQPTSWTVVNTPPSLDYTIKASSSLVCASTPTPTPAPGACTLNGNNYNALTNPGGYYVSALDAVFAFNLCAPLPAGPCSASGNVAVCVLSKAGTVQTTAALASTLSLAKVGKSLLFKYTGDSATSAIIKVVCGGSSGPIPSWNVTYDDTYRVFGLTGMSQLAC